MGNVAELDTTRLVIAAIIGLALLLVLIIKFKVHAMLSILIGAIAIGLIAGMPFEEIVTAVDDGIGNTLKGIALLVGLGSMFGAILEASGGAQTLAVTMVKKFGDEKAAFEKKEKTTEQWIFEKLEGVYSKEDDYFDDLIGYIGSFNKWSIFKRRPQDGDVP